MKEDPATGIKTATLLLLIVFVYLFCVTFLPMTDSGEDMAKTIVPFLLGSVVGTLIGFYWGNKKKDETAPVVPPEEEAAKQAAAKIEADRIAAAKEEAAKVEAGRIETAKAEGEKVIEAAKTDVKK